MKVDFLVDVHAKRDSVGLWALTSRPQLVPKQCGSMGCYLSHVTLSTPPPSITLQWDLEASSQAQI